jgi:hypothetical protein
VKHKLQQDTYIQRARMFGSRKDYLKYFELIIPQSLFLDWQKCFIFHRLSLESRKQNRRTPVWLDGDRISATASSSIDKTNVSVDRGEMSFELFDYEATKDRLADIIGGAASGSDKLKQISTLLGVDMLPGYLLNYITTFCPEGDRSLAVHLPRSIAGYTEKKGEMDKATITRSKGFIGDREMEVGRYPDAIHHVNVLFNESGRARVFYRYRGNVRFLKAGATA